MNEPADGIRTHCPYCALQCGMVLRRGRGQGEHGTPRSDEDAAARPEPPLTVAEWPEFPVNRGALCGKGQSATELLGPASRLSTPLVRDGRGTALRPATWDEALERVISGIRSAQAEHGPDAVGVFGGGGLTNEKAYLLGKFARVALGTSAIDYNGRFCMSSAAAAVNRAFGLDRGLPFPLADIAETDCVLLVGSNLADTMPPALRYLTELAGHGGRLIVVDPRRTRTAARADLHLRPLPGTDLALALGMLHIALAEGHVDEDFVAARTSGFEAVRAIAMEYWPARVEKLTGVPAHQIRQAVRMFARAPTAMVLTARGSDQHSKGTDTVNGWINLCLALGKAGRPRSGYGCLTGQGNGQGGREHGQKADQLPGYRSLTDPVAREHIARIWGIAPAELPGPGTSAYEMLDTAGTPGGLRAMLVFGSNPAVSAPRADHVEQRLRALDLLVVADVVRSETAELADVVLPSAQWAEETGTLTNLEGRVVLRRKAVEPPAQVRTDLEILAALAARLGRTEGFPADPRRVFDELRTASAGGPADYSGISYERITEESGVFWPCPEEGHPGTPRLFLNSFATPDGRARMVPVHHRPVAEETDERYPLFLVTGRVLAHYQSGAQTRRVATLTAAAPEPYIEIHPSLARRLGVVEGESVAVTSRRGTAVAPARLSTDIRPDVVFMPFHWSGPGRANTVTNPALDPVSRMPEFKVCAVRVEPVTARPAPPGAGCGAGRVRRQQPGRPGETRSAPAVPAL